MLPFWSTACAGKSTKLPGRAPAAVPGVNRPPGAASNIDMFRTSPMPRTWFGLERLSGNSPLNETTSGWERNPIESALTSTSAYGKAAFDRRPAVALVLTAKLDGPVPGSGELQAERASATVTATSGGPRRFSIQSRLAGGQVYRRKRADAHPSPADWHFQKTVVFQFSTPPPGCRLGANITLKCE